MAVAIYDIYTAADRALTRLNLCLQFQHQSPNQHLSAVGSDVLICGQDHRTLGSLAGRALVQHPDSLGRSMYSCLLAMPVSPPHREMALFKIARPPSPPPQQIAVCPELLPPIIVPIILTSQIHFFDDLKTDRRLPRDHLPDQIYLDHSRRSLSW